jgi:hypothetical protein
MAQKNRYLTFNLAIREVEACEIVCSLHLIINMSINSV